MREGAEGELPERGLEAGLEGRSVRQRRTGEGLRGEAFFLLDGILFCLSRGSFSKEIVQSGPFCKIGLRNTLNLFVLFDCCNTSDPILAYFF